MEKHINLEDYGFKSYKKENLEDIEKALEKFQIEKLGLQVSIDILNDLGRNIENLYVYCLKENYKVHLLTNNRIYFDGKFIFDFQEAPWIMLTMNNGTETETVEEKKEKLKCKFLEKEKLFYESWEDEFLGINCPYDMRPIAYLIFYKYGKMSDEEKYKNFIEIMWEIKRPIIDMPNEIVNDMCNIIPKEISENAKNNPLADENGYIKVYRGINGLNKDEKQGMLWTTNKEFAESYVFADNTLTKGKIATGYVHVKDILFDGNRDKTFIYGYESEDLEDGATEFIVKPGSVKDITFEIVENYDVPLITTEIVHKASLENKPIYLG
ncbi:MAG: hypothetical protein LLF98_11135 [Clostridium sp.]|uniref:hypothetical protein n=1 Tax=Clostridium sp. TaxID=1506 RepID=UPI0025C5E474|nr:hypothetical protein [Clostridium sp.]MCE5221783.1 hypothetical protein [Clostridium sp.]